MQTYKANQETILTTNFTRKYPGGPLAYLDACGKAAVRLEVVAPGENYLRMSREVSLHNNLVFSII